MGRGAKSVGASALLYGASDAIRPRPSIWLSPVLSRRLEKELARLAEDIGWGDVRETIGILREHRRHLLEATDDSGRSPDNPEHPARSDRPASPDRKPSALDTLNALLIEASLEQLFADQTFGDQGASAPESERAWLERVARIRANDLIWREAEWSRTVIQEAESKDENPLVMAWDAWSNPDLDLKAPPSAGIVGRRIKRLGDRVELLPGEEELLASLAGRPAGPGPKLLLGAVMGGFLSEANRTLTVIEEEANCQMFEATFGKHDDLTHLTWKRKSARYELPALCGASAGSAAHWGLRAEDKPRRPWSPFQAAAGAAEENRCEKCSRLLAERCERHPQIGHLVVPAPEVALKLGIGLAADNVMAMSRGSRPKDVLRMIERAANARVAGEIASINGLDRVRRDLGLEGIRDQDIKRALVLLLETGSRDHGDYKESVTAIRQHLLAASLPFE